MHAGTQAARMLGYVFYATANDATGSGAPHGERTESAQQRLVARTWVAMCALAAHPTSLPSMLSAPS